MHVTFHAKAPHGTLSRAILNVLAAIALIAALFGAWFWLMRADARALRALPDRQRLHLYQMTYDSLTSLCAVDVPFVLKEHCHQQARLILGFPECDGGCQELARRLLQPRK